MRKIILLIICACFISCHNKTPLTPAEEEVFHSENIGGPKIYLANKDELVSIKKINRGKFLLSLSDQITFSNEGSYTKAYSNLENIENLKNSQKEKNFKVKVASFCSYTDQKEDEKEEEPFNKDVQRATQELGSKFYRSNFSVFELIPKKVLLNHSNRVFYCSFIFTFSKNEEGVFDHYNMAQQPIEMSFGVNQSTVSLIEETGSGAYRRIKNRIIKEKDFYKVELLNNTKKPIENYQLVCEDSEVLLMPNREFNAIPIFVNLLFSDQKAFPEGVKSCRFFSRNRQQITGMSEAFKLDFDDLNKKKNNKILLDQVHAPIIRDNTVSYKSGSFVGTNNYFHFKSLNDVDKDYSFINIKINTQCFGQNVFGKGKVVTETYNIPLRKNFPLMAVTPKDIFLIHSSNRVSCLYKIKLENRYSKNNSKQFEKQVYFIKRNRESYGIDWIPSVHIPVLQSFLKLKEIHGNRAGYFNLNFFDIIEDPFFQIEGSQLDRIALECRRDRRQKKDIDFIEVSWPYNIQSNSISLKLLFSNQKIKDYIEAKRISLCRLMLYEDQILRYFSKEMEINR